MNIDQVKTATFAELIAFVQDETTSTVTLVAVHNELNPEKPVKKFATRGKAVERVMALIAAEQAEEEAADAAAEAAEKAKSAMGVSIVVVESATPVISEEFDADSDAALKQAKAMEASPDFAQLLKKASASGNASNSAGVAASWLIADVAAARKVRNGVSVTFNGETTEHKSVNAAFLYYGLTDTKHIRFRAELKAAGAKVYTETMAKNAKGDYAFVVLASKPAE